MDKDPLRKQRSFSRFSSAPATASKEHDPIDPEQILCKIVNRTGMSIESGIVRVVIEENVGEFFKDLTITSFSTGEFQIFRRKDLVQLLNDSQVARMKGPLRLNVLFYKLKDKEERRMLSLDEKKLGITIELK